MMKPWLKCEVAWLILTCDLDVALDIEFAARLPVTLIFDATPLCDPIKFRKLNENLSISAFDKFQESATCSDQVQ